MLSAQRHLNLAAALALALAVALALALTKPLLQVKGSEKSEVHEPIFKPKAHPNPTWHAGFC